MVTSIEYKSQGLTVIVNKRIRGRSFVRQFFLHNFLLQTERKVQNTDIYLRDREKKGQGEGSGGRVFTHIFTAIRLAKGKSMA